MANHKTGCPTFADPVWAGTPHERVAGKPAIFLAKSVEESAPSR
jgi:hypothetical protein